MGRPYYIESRKRWRVQFRYDGCRPISAYFKTKAEADKYSDLVEKAFEEKRLQRQIVKTLDAIQSR